MARIIQSFTKIYCKLYPNILEQSENAKKCVSRVFVNIFLINTKPFLKHIRII